MLPVSTQMRYQSLSDYPEILYAVVENARDHDEKYDMISSLQLC